MPKSTPKRRVRAQAPVALQRPKTLTTHSDSREDPFYWLRDDDRQDPDVLAQLRAENEYCKAALAPTEEVQARLFQEMRGRIQEADQSVEMRHEGYYYYTRTLEGAQYVVHCRRKAPESAGAETEASIMDDRFGAMCSACNRSEQQCL